MVASRTHRYSTNPDPGGHPPQNDQKSRITLKFRAKASLHPTSGGPSPSPKKTDSPRSPRLPGPYRASAPGPGGPDPGGDDRPSKNGRQSLIVPFFGGLSGVCPPLWCKKPMRDRSGGTAPVSGRRSCGVFWVGLGRKISCLEGHRHFTGLIWPGGMKSEGFWWGTCPIRAVEGSGRCREMRSRWVGNFCRVSTSRGGVRRRQCSDNATAVVSPR